MAEDLDRRAACRDEDPELFFPVGTPGPDGIVYGPAAMQQVVEAKAVCHRCPVAQQCLSWALEHNEVHEGVFGGMTGAERRALRDRLRRYARAS